MKIVLVEGNGVDRHAIRSMLEERRETVHAFANGLDAWSFIKENNDIDLIITSLNVQGMTGLEICWNARILAEQRKSMYVVAISEQEEADMLVEALDSGADDYLQKPLHEEILLARLRVAERMIMLQKQLIMLADHDPLTSLYNRRAFFEKAGMLVQAGPVSDNPIHAIMFDIDYFKLVNDTYGHDAGDEVIKFVARLANDVDGIVGRLGGEEFAIILSGYSLLQTARIADQLRQDIAATVLDFDGREISVTSSFGVAYFHPDDCIDDMLKRADMALYKSKRNGRNRVSAERPRLIKQETLPADQRPIRDKRHPAASVAKLPEAANT